MKNFLIWAGVIILVWIVLPSWIFKAAIGAAIVYYGYKTYLTFGGKPINWQFWKKREQKS
jgi:hypothetical protein